MSLRQGIKFLKTQNSSYFSEYKKNLENGKCVTCGQVNLAECDPTFGMCTACKKSVVLTPDQFDELWYSVFSINS